MKVVHLPVYEDNAYQPRLLASLRRSGLEVITGGGGNFLRTALMRWKASVVHFHWLHPYMLRRSWWGSLVRSVRFLAEVRLLKMAGMRVVWTIHNLHNHDRKHEKLERFFSRLFAGMIDAAIAHSPSAKEGAARAFALPPDRITVVPHPSYTDCYPNTVTPAEARQRLGLPPAALVVLFLGRIHPYKGVLELIGVFNELGKADARLVIAGKPADDGARRTIEEHVTGNPAVLFRPGYVPDDDLQVYMNAADVVAFPFRDVLTSGSVILAMSFGRACVAPAVGSIPEVLPPDGGFLYDPDDPQGLSGALHRALDRKADLGRMGEENLRRAREWTWDGAASATAHLYGRVAHCGIKE